MSTLAEPHEVVITRDGDFPAVGCRDAQELIRRPVPREGCHGPDDTRVGPWIDGRYDCSIEVWSSERDLRPVVVRPNLSPCQLEVDERPDRLDAPRDVAVLVLVSDEHGLGRGEALSSAGRAQERLVPEALGEAIREAVDGG